MAELIVSPSNPVLEQGQSVDLTITVDTHIDRLEFRDAATSSVTFLPSRREPFTDWDMDVDSPLTSDLLESDGSHAVFRVTWP